MASRRTPTEMGRPFFHPDHRRPRTRREFLAHAGDQAARHRAQQQVLPVGLQLPAHLEVAPVRAEPVGKARRSDAVELAVALGSEGAGDDIEVHVGIVYFDAHGHAAQRRAIADGVERRADFAPPVDRADGVGGVGMEDLRADGALAGGEAEGPCDLRRWLAAGPAAVPARTDRVRAQQDLEALTPPA